MKTIKTMKKGGAKSKCKPVTKMALGGGYKTGGIKKAQMGGTSSGFDPKAAKSDTDHLCDAYSKFGGPVKKKTVKAKKMQRGGGVIAKKGGSLKSKSC